MNLFELGGQLLGGLGQGDGGKQNLIGGVLEMVQNHPGGIAGLVERFQHGGFAEVANSWVSTGQNLPISAEQVQGVLGGDAIAGLASKLGLSPDAAASALSEVLPNVIDRATPQGHLPAGGVNLMDVGASLLQSLTGGR